MPSYTVTLKQRLPLCHDTVAFVFDKPADFTFIAGQFGGFVLNLPGQPAKDKIRSFTLVNPPYHDELMIVTRIRPSRFKESLMKLPLGTELKLNGAFGSFYLQPDKQIPAVFISGGMGIAPGRSIALQASRDKLPQQIFLFDANRRPEDAPFLQELRQLSEVNPNFTFIPSMSQPQHSSLPWSGETGYIDEAMLRRYLPDLQRPFYYVCGPVKMVAAMRKMLVSLSICEQRIFTEEFPGYN